jgi:hypothetical protein
MRTIRHETPDAKWTSSSSDQSSLLFTQNSVLRNLPFDIVQNLMGNHPNRLRLLRLVKLLTDPNGPATEQREMEKEEKSEHQPFCGSLI